MSDAVDTTESRRPRVPELIRSRASSARSDGTMRLFRAPDVIENEPLLPGFRMTVGEVFPPQPQT